MLEFLDKMYTREMKRESGEILARCAGPGDHETVLVLVAHIAHLRIQMRLQVVINFAAAVPFIGFIINLILHKGHLC